MPQIRAGKRGAGHHQRQGAPVLPGADAPRQASRTSRSTVAGGRGAEGLPKDVPGQCRHGRGPGDPALKQQLAVNREIVADTPEQFAKFSTSEPARWKKLIADRNIKAD